MALFFLQVWHRATPLMNYQNTIAKLYFLLISADGKIQESEIAYGQTLAELEGFKANEFRALVKSFAEQDKSSLLLEGVSGLKRFNEKQQIRAIAWLCAVANSDGFMDKTEWQFIYNLYHKELGLSMDAIMREQRTLVRSVREMNKRALAII